MKFARLWGRLTTSGSDRTRTNKREHATPLMKHVDGADDDLEQLSPVKSRATTPLPWPQLSAMMVVRLTEPVCYSLIFPFVNDMIENVGITHDPQMVGYYSGLVEGTFAFAQFFTVLSWGRLSDRIGRKPVLLIGAFGLIFSTILFGFARTFWLMLFARALSGALNGNVAVLRSSLGEITDKTNRARAFAMLPLTWSVGSILAPMLGGFLARPVEHLSGLFGNSVLFAQYPYLLPCIAGAGISLCGVILGIIFLKETLHSKRKNPVKLAYEDKDTVDSPVTPVTPIMPMNIAEPEQAASLAAILRLPRVRLVMQNTGCLALTMVMIESVFVLWLYTPVDKGGIGFDQHKIGITLSSQAVTSVFVNTLLFPPLTKWMGTTRLYLTCTALTIVVVLLFPTIHYFAEKQDSTSVAIGIGFLVLLRVIGGLVYPCNMMLINSASPSNAALGTVNGLAQMVASGMRAIGPAIASSLFALTMSNNLLGGQFIWVVQLCFCFFWLWQAFRSMYGTGSQQDDDNDDDS